RIIWKNQIYLPIVEEKVIVAKEKAEIHEKLSGSETILVVEDEETILDLIEVVLKQSGYDLITARDGQDAINKVQGLEGPIHLLLTDVVMPNLSGKDLSVEIRKRHPETKICFMSGYTDNAIVHHDILDENTNFIQKPFLPSFLLKKVREILDRKTI
ncbi:MAG: response regulator, partial [Anaerolineae bacterium]|nr:response regulator [Anaerolineae bacterium]